MLPDEAEIKRIVDQARSKRVLVLGDAIVDHRILSPKRLSCEELVVIRCRLAKAAAEHLIQT